MDLATALELATDLRPKSRLLADLPLAFTTVPDKTAGDVFTEAMWDTYLRDNLNSGVARMIADSLPLGASASSIDFSSIPATFASLMVVGVLRGDAAAARQTGTIILNNDTGANQYGYQFFDVTGVTATGTNVPDDVSIPCLPYPAATGLASRFSSFVLFFPNYQAGVAHHRVMAWLSGALSTATAADRNSTVGFGEWDSTAAINRITLRPASGNFVAGSRATVYGLPF